MIVKPVSKNYIKSFAKKVAKDIKFAIERVSKSKCTCKCNLLKMNRNKFNVLIKTLDTTDVSIRDLSAELTPIFSTSLGSKTSLIRHAKKFKNVGIKCVILEQD